MGIAGRAIGGVALILSLAFVQAVAARCAGEGASLEAMRICGCSVRHRLQAGWKQENVLDAYYARDASYTPAQLAAVLSGLTGKCHGDEYFYLSYGDAVRLRFDLSLAVAEAQWEGGHVLAFPREAWRKRR